MEKRLLLAVALSFLVLGLYTSLLPKKQVLANKEVIEKSVQDIVPQPAIEEHLAKPEVPAQIISNTLPDNELYFMETNGLLLKFAIKGGYLYEVFDKNHNATLSMRNIGLVKEWSKYPFMASEITRGVVFYYKNDDGLEIKKTFRIKSDNILELSVEIIGATTSTTTGYSILGGSLDPSSEKDQISSRYYEACAIVDGITVRKQAHGLKKPIEYNGHILWAGLRDRYFCSLIFPHQVVNKGVVENIGNENQLILSIPHRSIDPSQPKIEDLFKIYIGIQDEKALRAFGEGAEKLINYGTFDGISKVLLFFLKLAHKVGRNWGVAIILITLFVYLLLFPLSFKSMLSMKKMQALQPKIEELRAKFKDNPQKLNTEIMGLYRQEKANPFGGCLPMLLQIPVFFALYQLLMRFISLRGASFLWIKDLSSPDRLLIFKNSYPMIGNELNILPLLMAIGMFFQQKITAAQTSATPEAAQQQKIMTIMMPVIFGAMFYKLSAGLVLYWFVNSLLMLAFQWKISKIKV
ncbi:MAG: membrane protein insertase YidC [Candidatus Omnitrophica bacterium]|nr:membrane protein insertase YidC [Candidatus Omnitrophota bacterium]